jgi:hypothetical protein
MRVTGFSKIALKIKQWSKPFEFGKANIKFFRNHMLILPPVSRFFLKNSFVISMIAKIIIAKITIMERSWKEGCVIPKAAQTEGIWIRAVINTSSQTRAIISHLWGGTLKTL